MSGHRPWKELRDKLHATPEGRAAARRARINLAIMLKLAEMREGRGMTQADLADAMQVSQANVSRLENAGDMNVSTLYNFVAALGGTIEVHVRFEDQVIRIALADLDELEVTAEPTPQVG